MMQRGEGRRVGLCMQCGEYTERRFRIGRVLDSAPMCNYAHAHLWGRRQNVPKARIVQISGPREERKNKASNDERTEPAVE